MTLGTTVPIGLAERVVGLPVATVVVLTVLLLIWAIQRRFVVLGRELTALEEAHGREVAAMNERAQELEADRDWWRSTATTALNLGERAVAGRRDDE